MLSVSLTLKASPLQVDLASIHTAQEERMAAQACRVLGASGDAGRPHVR